MWGWFRAKKGDFIHIGNVVLRRADVSYFLLEAGNVTVKTTWGETLYALSTPSDEDAEYAFDILLEQLILDK